MNRRSFLHHSATAILGISSAPFISASFPRVATENIPNIFLLDEILDAALRAGAAYADIRQVSLRKQSVQVQNSVVSNIHDAESSGYALRVFCEGNFGFAASDAIAKDSIRSFVKTAVVQAKARAQFERIEFDAPSASKKILWQTPIVKNPFLVPYEEKIEFLSSLTKRALSFPDIEFSVANLFLSSEEQIFRSTTGMDVTQIFFSTYPNFAVTAVQKKKGLIESRNSFCEPQAMGYELAEQYPFLDEVELAVSDAKEKLSASPLESGTYDLIADPSHLFSLLDETLGYMMNPLNIFQRQDASVMYQSPFRADDIGKFRIASDAVTITGDHTILKGLSTCGYDDEGNEASKKRLIDRGIVTSLYGKRYSGKLEQIQPSAFADGWVNSPLSRTPNVILHPSQNGKSLEEMIASKDRAVLVKGRGSILHSFDRKSFQASPQMFWLIENGRISRMIRGAVYQARTLDFWNSCVEVGNELEASLGGTIFDMQGDPVQQGAHSVSTPPVIFKNIQCISTSK